MPGSSSESVLLVIWNDHVGLLARGQGHVDQRIGRRPFLQGTAKSRLPGSNITTLLSLPCARCTVLTEMSACCRRSMDRGGGRAGREMA